ncbi:hypothetical protein QA639_34415 [Bradyrhizobium pachyrhizi]|uniref:hypothetical protein n=1 Tax=Bradyrhizobium pachyrhizi TaxID=280333 RepID=UPI0024B0E9A5|nr:hypothetical protein [Bradyrhizobium pachyrhizi]WFU54643.1 hypothetical protein QA639_34415 [Bradyrhizobium pachyrhizi]
MADTPAIDNSKTISIPQNLIYAGVIVGLALIFFGIGLWSYGRGSQLSSLMTCVGFGLVLASFGSTAKGGWAGWTVTGAGALAIVLFLILQHYPSPSLVLKKGQLRGDFSKVADVRIIDEQPMYEYRDRTTSSVRFVLLEKKLKSSRLSLQVDTTEKGDGREFFELIGDAETIQSRYLSDGLDADKQIQWTFDYDKRVVKDGREVIFSERESLEGSRDATRHASWLNSDPITHLIISAARAQTAPDQPSNMKDLIEKLKSDDTSERRNARDQLSTGDPSTIPQMMDAFRGSSQNYRVRLGVVYALDEMIRRSPNQRSAISAALKLDDFPLLVSAASDDDKTVRMQAAEFLFLLQDPRAVPASVQAARDASDNSKATNQVLIIQQSAQSLTPKAKADVFHDLTTGPGANNDLVGQSGWIRSRLGF